MEQNTKIAAKKRIFDAAVSLFARRGFAAVGIREIAKKAGVNISMINYYFNGKAGILKEIINECYDKYYSAILDTGGEKTPLEERVRYLTRNMVDFFRKNTELAIVAFSTIVIRSFLTSIIFGFVEAQYCCDHIVQAPAMPIHLQDHFKDDDHAVVMDDSFYKKYVEILGCVYLHGVMSMSKKKGKKRSKKKRK
jgi:AcrR family transcriptional regulator